jgi:alanine dehydrogenase
MRIGIPRERSAGERRVGLTPQAASLLVESEHQVYVESGAGEPAGYEDASYEEAGARVVYDPAEIFGRAELIAKAATLDPDELAFIDEGLIVFGFFRDIPTSPRMAKILRDRHVSLVSYERIAEENGTRPVQSLMSEIAGSVAALKAVEYLMSDAGGIGLAPGFVWGVPPATFVVVGCGMAGAQAVRTAVGVGASVVAIDRDLARLRDLDRLYAGRVVTTMANRPALKRAVRSADALILAVNEEQRLPVVTREMVRTMRPRSVLVDLAVASGGAAETSRPTTADDPVFVEENVTHLCVPNLASLVARSASRALSNVTVDYLLAVAGRGPSALIENRALRGATIVYRGETELPSSPADGRGAAGDRASGANGFLNRAPRRIPQ